MKYILDNDPLLEGQIIESSTPKELLQYAVGALLYTPAFSPRIVEVLGNHTYPSLKAWSFCLEDSLADEAVEAAAIHLISELGRLAQLVEAGALEREALPLLFIRVRSAEQIELLYAQLTEIDWLLCGFIAPKFERSNMETYLAAMQSINRRSSHQLYLMPILESQAIMDKQTRFAELSAIRQALGECAEAILNVRVGGNDFCNQFGLRRGTNKSIYDIGVINDVLMDILNVFAADFVVSAPVWEYFGTSEEPAWQQGLQRELELDRLNGFIGKTAVHPAQLPIIQRSLMVEEADYRDALQILDWQDEQLGVRKGVVLQRMNEVRVHKRWAEKIMALSAVYGCLLYTSQCHRSCRIGLCGRQGQPV